MSLDFKRLKYSKRDALAAMWATSLHRHSTAEFLRTVATSAVSPPDK